MEDKSKTMMSLSPEKDEAIGTLAVSLLACIHVVRSKAFFILMIIIGGLLGVFQSNIIQSLIDKIWHLKIISKMKVPSEEGWLKG